MARTVARPCACVVRLATSEVRTVADVIPLDEFEREAQGEHARVVSALRDLAGAARRGVGRPGNVATLGPWLRR